MYTAPETAGVPGSSAAVGFSSTISPSATLLQPIDLILCCGGSSVIVFQVLPFLALVLLVFLIKGVQHAPNDR